MDEQRRRVGFLHCFGDVTASYTLSWVLSNFCRLDATNNHTAWSPPFQVLNGRSIELLLHFRSTIRFVKVVDFSVGVRCDELSSFRTKFLVTVRNSEFETIMKVEPQRASTERTGEKTVYTTPYVNRDTVMEKLSDGALEVLLEVNLTQSSVYSPFSIPSNLTEHSPLLTMSGQLSSLFRSGQCSDVVISVQGEEIPAHRAVLAARSKVFAAMFEGDFKEGQSRRVEITDFDVGTVRSMLQFMYGGRLEQLSTPLAHDLLPIADKYDVHDLKNYCGLFLLSRLEPANVVRVILAAYVHNADLLRTGAMDFFRANRTFVDVDSQRDILEQNPSLLLELLKSE